VGVATVAGWDVAMAVSRAKSYAGAAAVEVAGKAMQLHGGIGYAWESGVHAYLKRAALGRSLFGSPSAHRARLAVCLRSTAG
jgi:alkylation response protein AidB-like acyl-CoA dehydrogenase